MDVDNLLKQARTEFAARRISNVEMLCHRVLMTDPGHVQALLLSAMTASYKGHVKRAMSLLEKVLAVAPGCLDAMVSLSYRKLFTGDAESAERLARDAMKLHPGRGGPYYVLGIVLVERGERDAAAEAFNRSLQLGISDVGVYGWLEAAGIFEEPSKALPVEELLFLGERALAAGDSVEANMAARAVLARTGASARADLLSAKSLAAQDFLDEAKTRLSASISREPTASGLAALGLWEQASGELGPAKEHLEASIALDPKQGGAYYYLAQISHGDPSHLKTVSSLIDRGNLAKPERQLLCYAAAKTLEEQGRYEEAMARYDEANSLSGDGRRFDADAFVAGYDRFIELFPGPLVPIGRDDETPIFVVGMIRSGTTLLEQILTSHSKIEAGGEVPFWTESAGEAVDFQSGRIGSAALSRLASEYLEVLREVGCAATRVTDKMPANASLLGVIYQALPKAKIVHIRRNPADTCLSIYTTRFDAPPPYAGDKKGIALAYRQNARIMRHWKSLIPNDRLVTIDYEDLVADREQVLRRLLEFLGLEWEDACLAHEQKQNTVQTPSLWRVRQPVDQRSVSRWQRFRFWLPEFEGLEQF